MDFYLLSYQDTFNQLTYVDNEKKFLQQKVDFYQQDLTRYDKELQQILDNISTLSNAKSQSIQIKDTSVVGGIRNTISTAELRLAQNRIEVEEDNRKNILAKRDIAVDSLRNYQRSILELDNNADIAGELGPLKYLSGLTGYPMDKIINILLLIIIFVFDPLAVSLVIAANFAWLQAFPRKIYKENLYEEKVEVNGATLEEQAKYTNWEDEANVFDAYSEEDEKRMDIIGQNGNDGDHYDDIDEISIKNRILELHNSGYDTKDEEKRLEKLLKNIKKSK